MNLPEGWPTGTMWTAFEEAAGVEMKMHDFIRGVGAMLAAAPTPPVRHIADCSVVCLASQDDGIICPHDSCDIEDGTRNAPTLPAPEVEPVKLHADEIR